MTKCLDRADTLQNTEAFTCVVCGVWCVVCAVWCGVLCCVVVWLCVVWCVRVLCVVWCVGVCVRRYVSVTSREHFVFVLVRGCVCVRERVYVSVVLCVLVKSRTLSCTVSLLLARATCIPNPTVDDRKQWPWKDRAVRGGETGRRYCKSVFFSLLVGGAGICSFHGYSLVGSGLQIKIASHGSGAQSSEVGSKRWLSSQQNSSRG